MTQEQKEWFVGAMNDAYFVIDKKPRPSNDDVVFNTNTLVIAALGTAGEVAQRLVNEHNEKLRLMQLLRDFVDAMPEFKEPPDGPESDVGVKASSIGTITVGMVQRARAAVSGDPK